MRNKVGSSIPSLGSDQIAPQIPHMENVISRNRRYQFGFNAFSCTGETVAINPLLSQLRTVRKDLPRLGRSTRNCRINGRNRSIVGTLNYMAWCSSWLTQVFLRPSREYFLIKVLVPFNHFRDSKLVSDAALPVFAKSNG
jgi:hypothetical protein